MYPAARVEERVWTEIHMNGLSFRPQTHYNMGEGVTQNSYATD